MIVDHQRHFMNVLLGAEAPEEDLKKLGGRRERWLLYRNMVRNRMRNMIKSGFRRTVAALGEEHYRATYDAWLAEAPPRTRYIREIVPAFADFAIPRWSADEDVPLWVVELARYEATWWFSGYEDVQWPTDPEDFAFEKHAVMNPTLRMLRLSHPVHEKLAEGQTEYAPKATVVVLYRRQDDDRIYTWIPNALSADLIEGWMGGDEVVTDVVKRVCEARGVAIDQKFIESLGAMLADFMKRCVVLGGR